MASGAQNSVICYYRGLSRRLGAVLTEVLLQLRGVQRIKRTQITSLSFRHLRQCEYQQS